MNAGEGIRVWWASADELDAVAELLAGFRDHYDRDSPSEAEFRAAAARILADGSGEYVLGAIGEAPPAGLCQVRYRWSVWTGAEDCWIEDIFVRDDQRGHGLGRALLEAVFERASARGCKRVELDVDEDNATALALYERLGFRNDSKGVRSLLLGRPLGD